MDPEASKALESLRGDIRRVEANMLETRDELKRHSNVLFESLRDDIRILADGVASLAVRVEFLRPPGHAA